MLNIFNPIVGSSRHDVTRSDGECKVVTIPHGAALLQMNEETYWYQIIIYIYIYLHTIYICIIGYYWSFHIPKVHHQLDPFINQMPSRVFSPAARGSWVPGKDGRWLGARLHPLLLVPLGCGTWADQETGGSLADGGSMVSIKHGGIMGIWIMGYFKGTLTPSSFSHLVWCFSWENHRTDWLVSFWFVNHQAPTAKNNHQPWRVAKSWWFSARYEITEWGNELWWEQEKNRNPGYAMITMIIQWLYIIIQFFSH